MIDLQVLVNESRAAWLAHLERACEAALQGGTCGVAVDMRRWWAEPHAAVPYGHIYDVSACGIEGLE